MSIKKSSSSTRIANRPFGGPRNTVMDSRTAQVAPLAPQPTDEEIQRVMAKLSATDDVTVACANVGKIEREEKGFVWMWLFDLFTVAAQGQKIGQINRHVPCVLAKIDMRMLRRVSAYRNRILKRANVDESRGMSIGGVNITYGGGGCDIERIAARKLDKRGRCGGYGVDSDAPADEGNFSENFAAGGDGPLEKAWERADATANKVEQLWESQLERALAKNPDADIDTLRAEFDKKVVVKEVVTGDAAPDEVAADETREVVVTVTLGKESVDRALDEEPETMSDVNLESVEKGDADAGND
jgi:hypothetical protein